MSQIKKLIEKKHIFKKRTNKNVYRKVQLHVGTQGLVSLKNQQFELIYWRLIKKIIRREHIKGELATEKKKFWLLLSPNIIFSSKSVNSRMGAGVGKFIRVAIQLKSYKTFIEFKNYSFLWLRKLNKVLRYRCPLKFYSVNNRLNGW